MTFRRSRRVALLLSTVLAAGAAAPALAQSGSPHPLLDTNGVDLIDGSFNLRLPIASIGSGAAELALIATDGQRDNWSAMSVTQTLSGSTIQYAVSLGLQSDNFTSASASSTRGTGATLTVNPDNSLTYKSLDGVRILFGNPAEPQGGASNLCDMTYNPGGVLLGGEVVAVGGMIGTQGRMMTATGFTTALLGGASIRSIGTEFLVGWAPASFLYEDAARSAVNTALDYVGVPDRPRCSN